MLNVQKQLFRLSDSLSFRQTADTLQLLYSRGSSFSSRASLIDSHSHFARLSLKQLLLCLHLDTLPLAQIFCPPRTRAASEHSTNICSHISPVRREKRRAFSCQMCRRWINYLTSTEKQQSEKQRKQKYVRHTYIHVVCEVNVGFMVSVASACIH